MVTAEERMRILQMLQEGKLTPEAAAQLLQALEVEPPAAPRHVGHPSPHPVQEPFQPAAPQSGSAPRWLRVRVTDTDTGRPRVNVRLPIGLVNMGMKIGARYAPEIEGIDLGALLEAAQLGETGPFVDVYDDEDGEHVEVFLE